MVLQEVTCQINLANHYGIEEKVKNNFTTVLLNQYRNEKDSNGWHADNEKELGRNPIVASISLGEERIFQLKHNTKKEIKQNLILKPSNWLKI